MSSTERNVNVLNIDFAVEELREEYRIKRGTDYAIMSKYSVGVYVMCFSVYSQAIQEVFLKHDVPVLGVVIV